jgi:hypothetical protein
MSKGMRLLRRYAQRALTEKSQDARTRVWGVPRRMRDGKEERKEPLAPYPRRAMLTTMKAKWCPWATERRRVKEISRTRVAAEVRKIPRSKEKETIGFKIKMQKSKCKMTLQNSKLLHPYFGFWSVILIFEF